MARNGDDPVARLQRVVEEVHRQTDTFVWRTNQRVLRSRDVMVRTADLLARSARMIEPPISIVPTGDLTS
jgi:hypothetical protein